MNKLAGWTNLRFDPSPGGNRLIGMTMTNVAGIAPTNRLRLEFTYDSQGRRVQKKVSHWNSGDWILDSDSRFIYDGWNLLAILNSSFNLQTSFLWGQDLSGTMDQAGGIGGSLMLTIHAGSNTNCFVSYDGNGNLVALLDDVGGAVLARYEYNPFGELLRATGPMAKANPLQFSTKFRDEESGLAYYGYRYYSAGLGRWISKDPREETAGCNLYHFVNNCPSARVDTLGDMLYEDVRMLKVSIAAVLRAWSCIPDPFGKSLMYAWFREEFKAGGELDFKSKEGTDGHPPGEMYDIGGNVHLKPDQFGNYLVGYASGYAFETTGDPGFVAGTCAFGLYYRFDEHRSSTEGIVSFFERWTGQVSMVFSGQVEGVWDALTDGVWGRE